MKQKFRKKQKLPKKQKKEVEKKNDEIALYEEKIKVWNKFSIEY